MRKQPARTQNNNSKFSGGGGWGHGDSINFTDGELRRNVCVTLGGGSYATDVTEYREGLINDLMMMMMMMMMIMHKSSSLHLPFLFPPNPFSPSLSPAQPVPSSSFPPLSFPFPPLPLEEGSPSSS